MTIPEITAYVMALPVEELRRLTATDVMGWYSWMDHEHAEPWYRSQDGLRQMPVSLWRPDEDRNQSRMVTDKVEKIIGNDWCWFKYLEFLPDPDCKPSKAPSTHEPKWSPDQESRAALIAHMIHRENAKNDTNE